jgi:GTP-binding protein EngB required for normal cell division
MDPLETLLHRCHRDELLPLAGILRVKHEGVGMGDLSRALAIMLRRIATHDLANAALRGGHGLPYPQVLRLVAEQYRVPVSANADDASIERAIVTAHFQKTWDNKDPAARKALWQEFGIAGPAPETAEGALAAAASSLGKRFDYVLSTTVNVVTKPPGMALFVLLNVSPLGFIFRALMAPLLPLVLWWKLRPDGARLSAAVLEVARLRQIVLHRVTIGVVGSPSSGKDAGIRAMFGIDTGNISPIAGSTKEVAIQRAPGSTALYLVNTPGMGDVVERVTEEARQVLDHIDVYLYVVNAEGGVQAREKSDYERCKATRKPVLALINKIDVLRPRDKDKYLADARVKLGAPEDAFMAVAFDPLPELSPGPIGLEAVHTWIRQRLADLGKDPDELPPLPSPPAPPADSNAAPADSDAALS